MSDQRVYLDDSGSKEYGHATSRYFVFAGPVAAVGLIVVRRLREATVANQAAVLERMVVQWVADHGDHVRQARASLEDWERVRQAEPVGEDDS